MFRVLPCTDTQKVAFVTFTFKGEAYEWWLLTLERESNMTWQKFIEVFNKKYCPNSLREQKAAEFLILEQGNMTVVEYETKFTSLGRFATYVINTEERKARKFERGLRKFIRDPIEMQRLSTYAEVIDRAYMAEKAEKPESWKFENPKKRQGSNYGCNNRGF